MTLHKNLILYDLRNPNNPLFFELLVQHQGRWECMNLINNMLCWPKTIYLESLLCC